MPASPTRFSAELPQTDDFKSIILQDIPLIDVRAPVEFAQGAFANAVNLPLMDDDERHKVGLCYKQYGNETAVKLGHRLVSGAVREARIQAWLDFIAAHPNAQLYCFRGGQRSKIAQQWLLDRQVPIVRLKGGYKALRRYLIDFLAKLPAQFQQAGVTPFVIAGRTGAGKTQLLAQLPHALDLEGLANHRGSAFGRHATPQPTQINFENNLAASLLRFSESGQRQLVLEDEGRHIGSVNLPGALFDYLKSGEQIILETPLEARVAITLQEYVVEAQQEYATLQAWQTFITDALTRIHSRLGGERYQRVLRQFEDAVQRQQHEGTTQYHHDWIRTLLSEYYDPMYDYQIQKKARKIAFSGEASAVLAYLQSRQNEIA